MYKKILEYAKEKPPVYTPSSEKFWDDEYISKQMLEAHLNPDFDGASRKHSFIKQSVQWIESLCENKSEKKLLDLGCGPGIYAELFEEKGFIVTGIDFSKRSISYAKENAKSKQKNIEYFYQNYLTMDYENQFDVVTLIYCDFGVLNPKERLELLGKIKRALKPRGVLILDGFTKLQLSVSMEKQLMEYYVSGFWNPTPYVCIQQNFHYDKPEVFLEQYLVITEEECNCYNMWNQIFSKDSLMEELQQAGFDKMEFFDDVCGKTFSGDSNTICVAAKYRG